MKLNKDYVLREIGGELILVPTGNAIKDFNGLISLQGIGGFVIKCLEKEMDKEEILNRIMDEYEVPEDVAKSDLDEFLNKLQGQGILF